MSRAKKNEKNPAPKKSGRGRGAPLGNKNALGNSAGKGKPKLGSGRHARGAILGDPRNIKSTSFNRAEAASLDAKPAIAGLSRASLIRASISE